jgi:hypothetical protein
VKTTEEAVKIEECILFFGLDFFCVEIYRVPAKSPHEDYHIVLWNREYNYHKEVPSLLAEPRKRERAVAGVGSSVAKQRSKDIIKRIKPEGLDNSNFNTCWHAVEWSKNEAENNWAHLVGLQHFKEVDCTAIHRPLIKEMTAISGIKLKVLLPKRQKWFSLEI